MKEFKEVIIELSYNCNLACIMCGFGKHINPFDKKKFMSFDNYKSILFQIGAKTEAIRLNGRGESTIHPNFVKILNYTKRHFPDLTINLFSNFSFRNDIILNSIIDNDVQLFISIDSSSKEELEKIRDGSKYKFIVNNLQKTIGSPNRPFIVFTIQEENFHRIYDMSEFAKKHHCGLIYNTIRKDIGIELFKKTVKENKNLITTQFTLAKKLLQKSDLQCIIPDQMAGINLELKISNKTHGTMFSCPAIKEELCIHYDGTTTPCNMFNPYIYGNIFKNTLEEVLGSEERERFKESHKSHYYCKNCANLKQ